MSAPAPAPHDTSVLALQERLVEVESKLSLAEDLLETLNRTVYRQQQQIDRLGLALGEMRQQLRAGAPTGRGDPQDEVPPHY